MFATGRRMKGREGFIGLSVSINPRGHDGGGCMHHRSVLSLTPVFRSTIPGSFSSLCRSACGLVRDDFHPSCPRAVCRLRPRPQILPMPDRLRRRRFHLPWDQAAMDVRLRSCPPLRHRQRCRGAALYRRYGHDGHAGQGVHFHNGIDKLVGKKLVILVVELGLIFTFPWWVSIWLSTARSVPWPTGLCHPDCKRRQANFSRPQSFHDGGQIVLRHRKNDGNRLELRESRPSRSHRLVESCFPGPPVANRYARYRCNNSRIGEVAVLRWRSAPGPFLQLLVLCNQRFLGGHLLFGDGIL